MNTVIGVDLGTTTTCFGFFEKGKPKLIESESGNYLIPSVVTYTGDEILVGESAAKNSHKYPKTSVYGKKPFNIIGSTNKFSRFLSKIGYLL